MATCGVNNIPIGDKLVPSRVIVEALESVKGVTDLNTAITKSYASLPEGVTMKEWVKWYESFNQPSKTRNINNADINNPNKDLSDRLANLVNLANYDPGSGYEVGNYARRIFNRVKNNLLARGQGMTEAEMNTMIASLKSVLTKDKILQDTNKLRSNAKRNVKSKLGANTTLRGLLEKVLQLDPTLVPVEKQEAYTKILEEFGQRTTVLKLREVGELSKDLQNFLQGIPENLFAKTEKNAAVTDDTPVEVMVKMIKNMRIDPSQLSNLEEVEWAKELAKATPEFLSTLDNKQLQLIIDAIPNINNGFFSPELADVIIDAKAEVGKESVKGKNNPSPKSWRNFLERKKAGIKARIRGTDWMQEVIRSNPLTVIDEFFGNPGKEIYNATFGKLASAYSKFTQEAKGVEQLLVKAEDVLSKKLKGKNALARAKFLIKFYQIQREYEANQHDSDFENAAEWMRATLDAEQTNRSYNEESRVILEGILKEFEGKSAEQIAASLTPEMLEAVEIMDEINQRIAPKVLFVSGVLRGKQAKVYEFYTHHNVLADKKYHADGLSKRAGQFTDSKGPQRTAQSGVVHERTAGAKAISWDPFFDAQNAARGLLLDYYMTPVNREVLRTVIRMKDDAKTREQLLAVEALEEVVVEVLSNVFKGNSREYTMADAVVEDIKRLGYYATLASAPRAVAELTSNAAFAFSAAPAEMAAGLGKYRNISFDPSSVLIVQNVGSGQGSKLFEEGVAGSKHVAGDIGKGRKKKAAGVSEFENKVGIAMDNIAKYSGAKFLAKGVTKVSEKLISTPDRIISRPLWFGTFASKFKEVSGVEVDFDAIKEADPTYMELNKEAILAARQAADQNSVLAGATNNPFSSIVKIQRKGDGSMADTYRLLSGYLQTFMLFEYSTAKTAVISMMGNGSMTQVQGARVMAGVMARMSLYGVIYAMLSDMIAEALGFEGEDDEEEDWGKMLRNDMIGSMLTLFFGRGSTAFPKVPINSAIEYVNEKIVGKDYNPYTDSVVWSQFGTSDFRYGNSLYDFLGKFMGPYGPPVKGAASVWNNVAAYNRTKSKKRKGEIFDNAIQNSALQFFGYAGLIPLFKDVNKIFQQEQRRK